MTAFAGPISTPGCAPTITPADIEIAATPGYYNNEGGGAGAQAGEGIRSHLGEPYGPGFYAFGELLAGWRAESITAGMELTP